jgi:hypothetical protein
MVSQRAHGSFLRGTISDGGRAGNKYPEANRFSLVSLLLLREQQNGFL